LLAGREVGGEGGPGDRRQGIENGQQVHVRPMMEAFAQGQSFADGSREMETDGCFGDFRILIFAFRYFRFSWVQLLTANCQLGHGRGWIGLAHAGWPSLQWAEDDGDRAVEKVLGEGTGASEGLGAEGVALLEDVVIADAEMEAARKQSAQNGGLGAGESADGGLAFVEEEGGDGLILHGEGEMGSAKAAGSEGGIFAEKVKQLQAESLAGLLAQGLDGEEGSDLGGVEAVGVKDPESEDGALAFGALEIAGEEGGYFREDVRLLWIRHFWNPV
jgi:hypothetical protein